MLDQAERLRQMALENEDFNRYNTAPRIITVTSGKGGVGKSNFVVNLSITLQKLGKRVLIFDADMGMGNDDVLMGFLPKYNVFDIIFNNKNVEDVIIEGPFGVKLLPGGSGVAKINEITNSQRNNFLDKLSRLEDFDYVIMDTGAGISRNVLGFVSCCDDLFLIITPEPTSLMDSYSLLKAVAHFKIKDKVNVIVNRTYDKKEAQQTFQKFSNAVTNFLKIEAYYMGNISEDKKLLSAVRNQTPFVIGSPSAVVSQDIIKIADKIIGDTKEDNKLSGTGMQGLFKKIFNIFS